MKKSLSKNLIEFVFCIFISFIIINVFCFFYERQPGWVNTPNGASDAVREPYSYISHSSEGYSFLKTDRNGFLNPDLELADDYILMMGSSHTQARQISANKKYSVLVNDYFADDNKLHTYNIGCDGEFLPKQIKHFLAATEAFPNSNMITIEIYTTDYSAQVIESAIDQPHYDGIDASFIFAHLSLEKKTKNFIKKYFPIIPLIKEHIETYRKASATYYEEPIDFDEYKYAINTALHKIRGEYDRPIVFLYHPEITIEKDGSITLVYSKTWEIFKKACAENNIDIIDCGEDYLSCYDKYRKLPYGFTNTTLDFGHLNEVGHRILADRIINYLEDTDK